MAELKRCPYCGGEAVRDTVKAPHTSEPWHYVRCGNPNCHVEPSTAAYKKQSGATKAWNRRANND